MRGCGAVQVQRAPPASYRICYAERRLRRMRRCSMQFLKLRAAAMAGRRRGAEREQRAQLLRSGAHAPSPRATRSSSGSLAAAETLTAPLAFLRALLGALAVGARAPFRLCILTRGSEVWIIL